MKQQSTMYNLKKQGQNQIPPPRSIASYKCEICDKEFKKNHTLKQHLNTVHNFVKELQHHCNICQKVFKLQNQLKLHVKIAHENKKHHLCE